ncbi:MAG: hypothetical protein ACLTRS_05850 [Lachnospiraceae bacterium]
MRGFARNPKYTRGLAVADYGTQKLVHALCKKARIAIDRPMRLADCDNLAALAKEYRITITKTNPVSQSQVCRKRR